MEISVIIGSYRPGKCLYRCINSLRKQTTPPDEIIIGVDTLKDEQYIQTSPEISCRFVVSGKTGVSAARNAACQQAKGDIYAFIDDDATARQDWIERIHTQFNDKSISCAGGPVIPIFEKETIPEQWYWIIGCTGLSKRPICSNMAVRKEDFIEQGGFPEGLGRIKQNLNIGEETELILKLERSRKKIAWEPKMVVRHWCPVQRTQWSYILTRAYKEGLGKAIISQNYPMTTEQQFLKHYLTHPDIYTFPVLFATGIGFLEGKLL